MVEKHGTGVEGIVPQRVTPTLVVLAMSKASQIVNSKDRTVQQLSFMQALADELNMLGYKRSAELINESLRSLRKESCHVV